MDYRKYKNILQVLVYHLEYPNVELDPAEHAVCDKYALDEEYLCLREKEREEEDVPRSRTVVPRCWTEMLIMLCHVPHTVGDPCVKNEVKLPHYNYETTLRMVEELFAWDGMRQDVQIVVQRCRQCREKVDAKLFSEPKSFLESFNIKYMDKIMLRSKLKKLLAKDPDMKDVKKEEEQLVEMKKSCSKDVRIQMLDTASQSADILFMARVLCVVRFNMERNPKSISDLLQLRFFSTQSNMWHLRSLFTQFGTVDVKKYNTLDRFAWNLATHRKYLHGPSVPSAAVPQLSSKEQKEGWHAWKTYMDAQMEDVMKFWDRSTDSVENVEPSEETNSKSAATPNQSSRHEDLGENWLRMVDVMCFYEIPDDDGERKMKFPGLNMTQCLRLISSKNKDNLSKCHENDQWWYAGSIGGTKEFGIFSERGYFISLWNTPHFGKFYLFVIHMYHLLVAHKVVNTLDELEDELDSILEDYVIEGIIIYVPVSNSGLKYLLTKRDISSVLVYDEYNELLFAPFHNLFRLLGLYRVSWIRFVQSLDNFLDEYNSCINLSKKDIESLETGLDQEHC